MRNTVRLMVFVIVLGGLLLLNGIALLTPANCGDAGGTKLYIGYKTQTNPVVCKCPTTLGDCICEFGI
jgi:hypothetical protein